MRLTQLLASAALIAATATALPATSQADGLLGDRAIDADAGVRLGGVEAGAKATVGGSTRLDASVGTTTGTVVGSTVRATAGAPAAGPDTMVRADAADTIHARARVLSPRQLLKLCVTVGARGCEGASRSRQLALVDASVGNLSDQQLAAACASIGGGCAAQPASQGGSAAPGSSAGGGGVSTPSAASMAMASAGGSGKGTEKEVRITCRGVLASPSRYERGLVTLCRKIGQ